MNLTDTAVILGIAVPIAGLFVWAMRATIAPMRVVINNNTAVMDRIMDKLDAHAEKIGDHAVRIGNIETVHRLNGELE